MLLTQNAEINTFAGVKSNAGLLLIYTLAFLGVLLIGWGLWTWIAWALSGPVPITVNRTPGSLSWYAARVLEWSMVLLAIPTGIYVIRDAIRKRTVFTFDLTLCIAFILCLWQDPIVDLFETVMLFSTNFVNLSTWCSHMPISFHNQCPAIPEPLLFEIPFYLFNFVAILMGFNWLMRKIEARWPRIKFWQMLVITYALAQLLNFMFIGGMANTYLLSFPALNFSLFGSNVRYPLADSIAFSMFFAQFALIRFYKQKNGTTFIERRLAQVRPRYRTALNWFALNGFIQLSFLVVSAYDIAAAEFFPQPIPVLPDHLMGMACHSGEWRHCSDVPLSPATAPRIPQQ